MSLSAAQTNVLVQLCIILVGLLSGGVFTVPIIAWLKNKLNTSGGQTLFLLAMFSFTVTLVGALLDGSSGNVEAETWGIFMLAILHQAHSRYQQLKSEMAETKQ